ncbi:unnamed protein product [Arabis nemorensis]|uniref:DNA-directed RNA polymerase n=1 Tax=Arabis nemorensis TaxID=586526 RepID=A0A565BBX6_9BRAS|nr:unnamed protein product [Arabis nemorensis]
MLVEPSFDPTKNKEHDWIYTTVKFGQVTLEKPTFFTDDKEVEFLPWHARLQNMTYSVRMKVNVQVEVFTKKVVKSDKFKTGQDEYVEKKILDVKKQDIPIGRIPVMGRRERTGDSYKKGECAFDQGGYFVIKGAEKVFIAQEQMCTKRLWISSSPWTVSYRSETKRNRFIVRLAENQKSEDYKRREKVLIVYFLSTEIPVWVLFFALGVSSDQEVVDLIGFDGEDAIINNSLNASICEADAVCREGRNALAYVDKLVKNAKFRPSESVDDCLRLYLFLGLKSLKQKARFLGYMEDGKGFSVVANLGHANPLQTLIDLRRTQQQVLCIGKVGDARYPPPSQWGRVCFLSTADGENCGLVKNMSLLGLVSTQILEHVVEKLFDCGMEELMDDTSTPLSGKHKVLLNGDWVGLCSDSESFVAEVKSSRCQTELPLQIEIKQDKDDNEVRIFTDAGRLLRPLLVVENLHKLKQDKPSQYSFEHLLDQRILELIGIEEEEDCTTSWGIKQLLKEPTNYTHCELDCLSCWARRVLYQSQKHYQQAIGFSSTNPNIRCDILIQQLFYPQKPLFKTLASECLQKEVLFNGQNAIVAVNVHLGYNQKDSIVMNKASLERGMFCSEQIQSFKAEADSNDSEKRKKMDELVQFRKTHSKISRVDSLDDDGSPFIGANMHSGDIVIGRCTQSGTNHSVKLKHTERGIVQKVVISSNDDGKNFAAVSLRQVRFACLGDKFSSMHGQKGVLGYLEELESFLFTIRGIVPDIVINPHAFPSRQTLGQLLEAALSKGIACPIQKKKGSSNAYTQLTRHATPFSTPSVNEITEQLRRAGFSKWGNERVYNGRSGEMVCSLIFMGPTFYQRLVHMLEHKVKFRNTGPVHPVTRQPVEDRKRFGGIKFGEMERDYLIAHGASANLHERLVMLSDSSQMHIYRNCQTFANVIESTVSNGRKIRGPYCRLCDSSDHVVWVYVPYGAKLLC